MKKLIPSPLFEQFTYSVQSFFILIVASKVLSNYEFGLFNIISLASVLASAVLISITFSPMVPLRVKLLINQVSDYDSMVVVISLFYALLLLILSCSYFLYEGSDFFLSLSLGGYFSLRVCHEFVRRYLIVIERAFDALLMNLLAIVFLFFLYIYDFELNLTLQQFIFFFSACYLFILLIQLNYVFIKNKSIKTNIYTKELMLLHIKESKWLFFSSLLQIFSANYFLVALVNIQGGFQLAVFRSIQNITNLFNPLISYFDNSIYVELCRNKNISSERYVLRKLIKFILLLSPILLTINLFSRDILKFLYNDKISEYWVLTPIFSMSVIVVIMTTFFRIYLRSKSINSSSFWAYIVITAIAFSTSTHLVTKYGVLGASIGVLATQVVFLLFICTHFIYEKNRNRS